MSAARVRWWCAAPPAPSPAVRNTRASSTRDVCHAGTSPKSSVVNTDRPAVNASTVPSSDTSSMRGMSWGPNAASASSAHSAASNPAPPPSADRSALSTNSSRAMRPRLAPSASRTDVSASRDAARANSRCMRLAHAMSSTSPTAPSSKNSEGRTWPSSTSRKGSTLAPMSAFVAGCRAARPRATAAASAFARSRLTPGPIRPYTSSQCAPRASGFVMDSSWTMGVHSSARDGKSKPGAITPTTVHGTGPPRFTARPSTSGLPPKRRCQSACDSTVTWGAPGASSPARSARPNCTRGPSTWKKSAVTSPACTFMGEASSRSAPSVTIAGATPASPSKARVCSRRSIRSGGDVGPGPCWPTLNSRTSRASSRRGNGRSSTACTTLKMATLAPMPSASVATATTVKVGLRRSRRSASRRSWRRGAIGDAIEHGPCHGARTVAPRRQRG
ncbi:hypothetical protein COEX109129_14910 [Corallococcus exiguus]